MTARMSMRKWLRKPPAERRAAVARFREADDALQANSRAEEAAGIRHETDEYLDLNDRVNALWDTVPFWRHW